MELVFLVVFEILRVLCGALFAGAVDLIREAQPIPPARPGISPLWLFLGLVVSGLLLLFYLRSGG